MTYDKVAILQGDQKKSCHFRKPITSSIMAVGESNMSHFEALTLKFSFHMLTIFSHVSVIPKNKIQIMAGKHL